MATEFYVLALTVMGLLGFVVWFAKNRVISFGLYRVFVWGLFGLVLCLLVWIFALLLLS